MLRPTGTSQDARDRMDTAREGCLEGEVTDVYLLTLLDEVRDWHLTLLHEAAKRGLPRFKGGT